MKSLTTIVENLENKILVNYRFDKNAEKKHRTCRHCIHLNSNVCKVLNDSVKQNYTCNKFEKKNEQETK